MSDETKFEIQFEALKTHITGMAESVSEASAGNRFGRIVYRVGDYEYLVGLTLLHVHKTPAQQAEEEGRPFEGGVDHEAHPAPLMKSLSDMGVFEKTENRDDDKHVAQNGSD